MQGIPSGAYTFSAIDTTVSAATWTRGNVYDLGIATIAVQGPTPDPQLNAAFAIFDAAQNASDAATSLFTSSANQALTVLYPATPPAGWQASAWYSAGANPTISITAEAAYSFDTVEHESGHFIADQLGFADTGAGDHKSGVNSPTIHLTSTRSPMGRPSG